MRHLTFLLFTALVTTSVIDVRTSPVGEGKPDASSEASSSSFDSAATAIGKIRSGFCGSFNVRRIIGALDPLNMKLRFPELFVRILIGMKKKSFELSHGQIFVQQMSELSENTTYGPHFKILWKILHIYDMYEVYRALNRKIPDLLIQTEIQLFLFRFTEKTAHVRPRTLAPSLTQLFEESGDVGDAKNLTYVLLYDEDIQRELISLFPKAVNRATTPYNYVYMALYP